MKTTKEIAKEIINTLALFDLAESKFVSETEFKTFAFRTEPDYETLIELKERLKELLVITKGKFDFVEVLINQHDQYRQNLGVVKNEN